MLLALGIASVTVAAVIELNRENPLVDVRWLASRQIVHLTAALLIFRIVLSEHATGATGFFQVLGLMNEQMTALYWVILLSSLAGGIACGMMMKPGREPWFHVVALALLVCGALFDSRATNLTRPAEMFVSQAMIAFAGALFLPPAMASGLMAAFRKGQNYILSFVIVFLSTQSIGGLLGSAIFGSFVTLREKFHSNVLVEHVTLTDPLIAQRIAQLEGVYGRVLTDKAHLTVQGLSLLGQQATREANMLAYNDMFLLVAIIAAFALAALLVHMVIAGARRGMTTAIPQPAN